VALAGAVVAGDHEVVVAVDKVEAGELEDEVLVEAGLKVPVERLEGLALDEPAGVDSPVDALFELVRGLAAEDVLEERGRAGPLAGGPREQRVELVAGMGQSEEVEVSAESVEDGVGVGASAVAGLGAGAAASVGHAGLSWVRDRAVRGRRSYWVRSRGVARAGPSVCSSRRVVASATYSSSVRGRARRARMRSTAA
jgi:hypothetical protein